MITIKDECTKRKRSPLSLDKMSQRFQTTNEIYTFTSPSLDLIKDNLFFLLRNSVQKEFNQQYKMRPEYLSYDEYGTIILGQLLMYVNGIYCPEEFDMDFVTIPTLAAITEMTTKKIIEQISTVDL